jgi:hypothetical protein
VFVFWSFQFKILSDVLSLSVFCGGLLFFLLNFVYVMDGCFGRRNKIVQFCFMFVYKIIKTVLTSWCFLIWSGHL